MGDNLSKAENIEEKVVKMKLGLIVSSIVFTVTVGVWIGTIERSMANMESNIESHQKIIEGRQSALDSINQKLAKIEGILEEVRNNQKK